MVTRVVYSKRLYDSGISIDDVMDIDPGCRFLVLHKDLHVDAEIFKPTGTGRVLSAVERFKRFGPYESWVILQRWFRIFYPLTPYVLYEVTVREIEAVGFQCGENEPYELRITGGDLCESAKTTVLNYDDPTLELLEKALDISGCVDYIARDGLGVG